jgi:hypothetical protein
MYLPSSVLALHMTVCDHGSRQYDHEGRIAQKEKLFELSQILN